MRYAKIRKTGERTISPDADAMMSNRRLTALLICQSFNQVDDFPIGNVAPEAADDFIGLNGVVFAFQNIFGGLNEAVHVAGTVVFVRQQVQEAKDFGIGLAVQNRFLQSHIVGEFVGNRLHGVAMDGVDGNVAAFGNRHHFRIG
ncbi:hypothetical protein BN1095_4720001 [Clostridioides difficile]|uniref:Uncharacterized protein n=1 Tax=Clostridioides difficile TaxID=1496 RepID=A0A069AXU8_CLODI|nr:hypothetical protein BN1095_4720001 [Clostridioides difficile]